MSGTADGATISFQGHSLRRPARGSAALESAAQGRALEREPGPLTNMAAICQQIYQGEGQWRRSAPDERGLPYAQHLRARRGEEGPRHGLDPWRRLCQRLRNGGPVRWVGAGQAGRRRGDAQLSPRALRIFFAHPALSAEAGGGGGRQLRADGHDRGAKMGSRQYYGFRRRSGTGDDFRRIGRRRGGQCAHDLADGTRAFSTMRSPSRALAARNSFRSARPRPPVRLSRRLPARRTRRARCCAPSPPRRS